MVVTAIATVGAIVIMALGVKAIEAILGRDKP